MSTPYMRLYWGDYSRKTRHLKTAQEHGAYLLLIGALFDNGGRLPADDATIAAHALLTAEEWSALKPRIMPFFTIRRGKLGHDRVDEELDRLRSTSGKRKRAGKAGGEATARKRTGNRPANARQMPTYSESESESPRTPRKGGLVELKAWEGSGDILQVLTEVRDRRWALSVLQHCREQYLPRALIVSAGWAFDAIRRDAAAGLRSLNISLVLEQDQVA